MTKVHGEGAESQGSVQAAGCLRLCPGVRWQGHGLLAGPVPFPPSRPAQIPGPQWGAHTRSLGTKAMAGSWVILGRAHPGHTIRSFSFRFRKLRPQIVLRPRLRTLQAAAGGARREESTRRSRQGPPQPWCLASRCFSPRKVPPGAEGWPGAPFLRAGSKVWSPGLAQPCCSCLESHTVERVPAPIFL